MINNKWIGQKNKENRKYSARLMGLIVLATVTGLSFRVAYDSSSVDSSNNIVKDNQIRVQNESPLPPDETPTPITGSGSMVDQSSDTGSGSQIGERKTGSGSQMDDQKSGTGSGIGELRDGEIECGKVDSNNNGMVDLGDMKDFERAYQQVCSKEIFKIADKCGQKDYNSDGVITITDFINIISKLKQVKCD